MKKIIKRIFLALIIVLFIYGFIYAWQAFPIISGYGAKSLCSCKFLSNRDEEDVIKKELGTFPLSLGNFEIDLTDSSATGSVFGLGHRKAIYRKGLGCTLINEISEKELRQQMAILAMVPPATDSLLWPIADTGAVDHDSINYEKLNAAIDTAFADTKEKPQRQTRGIIVVYKDRVIAEKYADGFTENTRHIAWSMTKSITNALAGILVKQGKLNINAPAPVDAWQQDDRKNITLNNLLQASSGLAWEENYNGPSDATNMLYKSRDMAALPLSAKLVYPPGSHFYYSSGTTNILSRIIRQTVGDKEYYRFPYTELFYKIGMNSAVLEPDAGGTFTGSSYCFATLRDYARFGLLYLHDGIWGRQRILPEGWVQYSRTPAKAAQRGEYGAQFWLNAGQPGHPSNRTYPDVPTDCFYADGYQGQAIWIIPSKNLIVARVALEQGNKLDENRFLAGIISALP